MLGALSHWRALLEHEAVLSAFQDAEPDLRAPRAVAALRRALPPDLVAPALSCLLARQRAGRKFPGAARLLATPDLVEQASSLRVARHKAARFRRLLPDLDRIVDLCCGLGGDAWALQEVAPTVAVDLRPERAFMARHNAGCRAIAAPVESLRLRGAVFHLDPSRRADGERRHRFEESSPGPSVIEEICQWSPTGAIKLGPGVQAAALTRLGPHELEIVGEGRGLCQAVVWRGALAPVPGRRTATRLPAGRSFSGSPGHAPPGPPGARYLLEVDPAVVRADLDGALAAELGVGGYEGVPGLLSSDRPATSAWVTVFELLAAMPWRERRVRAWLRERRAGSVEVKSRGRTPNANAVAKRLRARLSGDAEAVFTIFLLEQAGEVRAVCTRRARHPPATRAEE